MADETVRTIRDLEENLSLATLANDLGTTAELLTEGWLNLTAAGGVTTKAASLAAMPSFRFVSVVNDDVRVRVYAEVAVVTGTSERTLEAPNGGAKSKVRFARVWVRFGERWQVVTSQATPFG